MTARILKLIGGFLYYIGALTLVPICLIFVASTNIMMRAGTTILLILLSGAVLGAIGKWMLRRAKYLEDSARKNVSSR